MDSVEDAVKELVAAMREFVQRVEAGEIRSVHTYNRFKEALRRYDAVTS